MKSKPTRICTYPKDIERVTGKSYRQSTRMLFKIKASLNKVTNEFLTINEFCQYAGLNYEEVQPLILG